jgi:hypothetical protein
VYLVVADLRQRILNVILSDPEVQFVFGAAFNCENVAEIRAPGITGAFALYLLKPSQQASDSQVGSLLGPVAVAMGQGKIRRIILSASSQRLDVINVKVVGVESEIQSAVANETLAALGRV